MHPTGQRATEFKRDCRSLGIINLECFKSNSFRGRKRFDYKADRQRRQAADELPIDPRRPTTHHTNQGGHPPATGTVGKGCSTDFVRLSYKAMSYTNKPGTNQQLVPGYFHLHACNVTFSEKLRPWRLRPCDRHPLPE